MFIFVYFINKPVRVLVPNNYVLNGVLEKTFCFMPIAEIYRHFAIIIMVMRICNACITG